MRHFSSRLAAPLIAPSAPNDSNQQVAILADDSGILIAIGTGSCVCIHDAQLGALQQQLGPHHDVVGCLRWCHGHKLLAVGVGEAILIYSAACRSRNSRKFSRLAEVSHGEPACTLEWISFGGAPMLWTSGRMLQLWSSCERTSVWSVVWHSDLSQRVRLMSASLDGKLLATTGTHDRLLKVWDLSSCQAQSSQSKADSETQGYTVSFCYLRHSRALQSFEWRPAASKGLSSSSRNTQWDHPSQSGKDRSILLSLSADGIARLWSVIDSTESILVTLCATLGLENMSHRGLTLFPDSAPSGGASFQLVQWLQPTSRPSGFGDSNVVAYSDLGLSDSERTSRSFLGSPRTPSSPGLPTLRPSLHERHDYVLAIVPDGSLIVWLLLGLSTATRESPKVVIYASLLQTVSCVKSVLASSAFCHFEPCQDGRGSHADDRLPSAVSLVQHVADEDGSCVRLYTIDVDRATCGDRTHLQTLQGHSANATVVQLLPHSSLPLVASIASNGEMVLWDCPLVPSPSMSGVNSHASSLCDGSATAKNGAPRWLLRMAGSHSYGAWVTSFPMLLVVQGTSIELWRTPKVRDIEKTHAWRRSSHISLDCLGCQFEAHALLSIATFHAGRSPHTLEADHGSGFALGVGCTLGVWAVSTPDGVSVHGTESFHWVGHGSVAPSGEEIECCAATPLPQLSSSTAQQPLPGGGHGSLAIIYCDARICIWTVTCSPPSHLELAPGRCISLRGDPELSIGSISSLCVSSQGASLRLALICYSSLPLRDCVEPFGSTGHVQVLEFASNFSMPHKEFELALDTQQPLPSKTVSVDRSASCALTTLACSVLALVVNDCATIRVFLRYPSDLRGSHNAAWALMVAVPTPCGLHCSAVTWLRGGSLLAGIGAQVVAWPAFLLLAQSPTAQAHRPLPQWHPAVLKHNYLSGKTCDVVLHHLNQSYSLQSARRMQLDELISTLYSEAAKSVSHHYFTPSNSSMSHSFFEPTVSSTDFDFFAPSEQLDLMSQLSVSQTQPNVTSATPTSTVSNLIRKIKLEEEIPRHLDASEKLAFIELLETLQKIDIAGSALDTYGARFLIFALESCHSSSCVSNIAIGWALLSECHATLLDICLSLPHTTKTWPALRWFGIGYWVPQGDQLKAVLEDVAKQQFTQNQRPEDCALLYIALGKKKQLQALCKAVRNDRLQAFLGNDFLEPRWRSAAMKNAYALLSKQQFALAAAFFLLANEIHSAVKVCARQLADIQLAIVLCRLHSVVAPSLLHELVNDELLPLAKANDDRWLLCVASLMVGEAQDAFAALADDSPEGEAPGAKKVRTSPSEPCAAAFCSAILLSPHYRLNYRQLPCGLLLRSAYAFRQAGMPLNALHLIHCARRDAVPDIGTPQETDSRLVGIMLEACTEILLQRARELISESDLDMPSVPPSRYAQAMRVAADEVLCDIQVMEQRYEVSRSTLVAHLSEHSEAVGSTFVTPYAVLLVALQLWEQIVVLSTSLSLGLATAMWSEAPHRLRTSVCPFLLRSSTLICASHLLLAEASQETDDASGHVLTVVLALYAMCVSLGRLSCLPALLGGTLDVASIEKTCIWESLSAVVAEAHEEATRLDESSQSLASEYIWSRLHLLVLSHLSTRRPTTAPHSPSKQTALRICVRYAFDCTAAGPLSSAELLLDRWQSSARRTSYDVAAHLPISAYPLNLDLLGSQAGGSQIVSQLWTWLSCDREQVAASSSTDATAREASAALEGSDTKSIRPNIAIWPLANEFPGALDQAAFQSDKYGLQIVEPLQVLHRKGDFARCVCVNALNQRQLAVSLSKGVHQLELTDCLAEREGNSSKQTVNGPWGALRKELQPPHDNTTTHDLDKSNLSNSFDSAEVCVHQSLGSDITARCLCSHPKLPLYLTGGDSVVQCWQFGQTVQGRGLHDHLRSQYKLPAGDRVTSLRISPCGEQFASMDANGCMCLWRFSAVQRSNDMPLPFTRMPCHSRRGADLCFVGSSVLLASVGQSTSNDNGNSSNLSLWDVLLPPAQAQIASCQAHADGGCSIAYCSNTQSLISGGERGEVAIFDLRQRRQRCQWNAHTLAVKCLAIHEPSSLFLSASADGDMKMWSQNNTDGRPYEQHKHAHEPHTMLHPLPGTTLGRTYGVNHIILDGAERLLSAGADGKVKLWSVRPVTPVASI